jgi:hypothetical protein
MMGNPSGESLTTQSSLPAADLQARSLSACPVKGSGLLVLKYYLAAMSSIKILAGNKK